MRCGKLLMRWGNCEARPNRGESFRAVTRHRACSHARQLTSAFKPASFCAVGVALITFATPSFADPIETEHLFGFTVGTDVGSQGEREFESGTTARIAKRSGTYAAVLQETSLEFVPAPNLRTEFTVLGLSHNIAGVSGFDDRRQSAIGGVSADFRYQLLDRASAPFGLAVGADPYWARIEEATGEAVRQYGVDFVVAIDREIIRDRIVAAFNLLYQPEVTRSRLTGVRSQESTAGIATAVMAQIQPGIFVGAEARYLRRYEGLGLDALAGQGIFLGPTLYVKLSERVWFTAAYSAQVTGRAVGDPRPLDLVNFERHQARFLFGVAF